MQRQSHSTWSHTHDNVAATAADLSPSTLHTGRMFGCPLLIYTLQSKLNVALTEQQRLWWSATVCREMFFEALQLLRRWKNDKKLGLQNFTLQQNSKLGVHTIHRGVLHSKLYGYLVFNDRTIRSKTMTVCWYNLLFNEESNFMSQFSNTIWTERFQ